MDLLRQLVASPRARHAEAGLDLCYVTDFLIATSGPGATYPQVAYRNPLKDLVKFLDSKHGDNWAIWEFRAEGTGYPDEEVYNRIRHYPWPDHHPPPFSLIPLIMASMRNWLKGKDAEGKERVAVVHCKAGKGRSGTVSASYLISEEGWTAEDAKQRFTDRRMRPGFGAGISIPSQVRWINYVDRWTKNGKIYVERPVEIVELHVWGLRNGVKIAVEGFVDEGKIIKTFHTFQKAERQVVRGDIRRETGFADVALDLMGKKKTDDVGERVKEAEQAEKEAERTNTDDSLPAGGDVVFRPSSRVVLPSSDVNIDFERRNKSKYGGFAMVTAVAHVWFNVFFEGNGPENKGVGDDSGVFDIDFDAMDGIKGSLRKGTRCFDRMSVVWKAMPLDRQPSVVITEPSEGEEVEQKRPADWRGGDKQSEDTEKKLGLREANSESAAVSRASSVRTSKNGDNEPTIDEMEGVQSRGPDGKALDGVHGEDTSASKSSGLKHAQTDPEPGVIDKIKSKVTGAEGLQPDKGHVSTADLPDGVPEDQLQTAKEHNIGHMKVFDKSKAS
ncbi:hypothetical protein M409DRAFT_24466 [Zasmidium cellare ATCC 36951]|uniref:phosphatidylinositol-3,4,5-trisphosphate 3-phosphatase n=1 Tax=Zasmidium cellare ATCC 36951 TaxID=1080233 RepID=A0A6A6CFZ3_ZASCE|nr:uncharacterized protein M409DRAFT_24466 [Zasmidium cellare ATCC 36951]KAF2165078.1 hypothetical protein M409DRAFT_24466 [Zasmidium cellare ATCC 36951]